jgi:pimeloyl-ACP methyl ester carboxylesterase
MVELPGCGHIPTWDDPELVSRVVLEASSQRVDPGRALG